jgi:hypothetical protein
MNDAVSQMLDTYACKTRDDYTNALREILQQLALLGLWRSKFFEHAAFYGGTALRILHGLDRYSEDLDFSLLNPDSRFTLGGYGGALQRELASFGFNVEFEARPKSRETSIESAFLKANTLQQLIVIKTGASILGGQHAREVLKIKLEVDTEPPGGFQTVSRPVLVPIPFAVNAYSLPDLFAGKMHAILCRKWKNRVKGRDWYDLIWYLGRHPQLRLNHLEQRMRQSGDWAGDQVLSRSALMDKLTSSIRALDVTQARTEVARFVRDRASLDLWSHEFFLQIVDRLETV